MQAISILGGRALKKMKKIAATALAMGLIIPQATPAISYAAVNEDVVQLRILETTDLHSNMMNYDYYQDKESLTFGFAKTATLIKKAKEEADNSLLFDNGDLIQGSPMGDYVAKVNKLENGEVHPVYKAMNLVGYDAGNLGNHEFNYGLEFLDRTLKGAAFPYVNSNVYIDDQDQDETNDENAFTPYIIMDKEVTDEDGEKHTLKVGVIGFVPPQITTWDAQRIGGEVIAKDIVETAKKFVPQMKAEGAELIVAIPHSGIDASANGTNEENAVYNLSKVEGIDAILFGHSHATFPSAKYAEVPGADIEKGTLNGVATVQAGMWGDNLGLIDMTLEKKDGKWTITDSQSSTRQIYVKDSSGTNSLADADQDVIEAVKQEHEATIEYMKGELGQTTAPINSYFSQVKDNEAMQVLNAAQKWYTENAIQGTEFEGLPVLSAAAPFKAGTRDNVDYYTDIPAGPLQIKNAADLYLYDNNVLNAIVINGAQLKEWLEMTAGQFNQIKKGTMEEQNIINSEYRSYNFDVIDGVSYQVDVLQPAKYDTKGQLVNEKANRIVNLQFEGKPVDPEQKFVVATNDYRASGSFPGVKGSEIIVHAPESSREVVAAYIVEKGTIDPTPDMNWTFKEIKGNVNVYFLSSPKAKDLIGENDNFSYIDMDPSGFAKYDLNIDTGKAHEFKDVAPGHWAKTYIDALVEQGLVNGKSETEFAPEAKLTRGQFIAMIVRAMGLSDGTVGLAKEVQIAYENGITNLTPKQFGANNEITREQMAAMIVRAHEKKTGEDFTATKKPSYKDAKKISKGLVAEVEAAYELGFMTGNTNNTFSPKVSANRAQGAKVIYTFIQE